MKTSEKIALQIVGILLALIGSFILITLIKEGHIYKDNIIVFIGILGITSIVIWIDPK